MSSPRATPDATIAQRLQRVSPPAYAAIGPVARFVRRAAGLASGSLEVALTRLRIGRTALETPPCRPFVVLDGCAFQEPDGGIARMWRSILREWAASGFARQVAIIDRGRTAPREPGFTYVAAPRVRQPHSRSQRVLIEDVCSRVGAAVFLSTGFTRPLRARSALLLHDMTPEVLGWNRRAARWREKQDAIGFASSFICISQSTLDDLHRFYPSSAAQPAAVVHCGVDPGFHPATEGEVSALRTDLSLPGPYVLFVGRREGYKNAALLLDALRLSGAPHGVGVLFAGGSAALEPELADAAAGIEVRLARLDDDELRAAYSAAAALVYPSRYEGFGLPVVEAMACGCPVITCRNSSLPEVGGDAAIYVDESDPRELMTALSRVLMPDVRERFARAGLERAARFNWSSSAEAIRCALLESGMSVGRPLFRDSREH